MKKVKNILSLVLALLMVMSIAVTPAGAVDSGWELFWSNTEEAKRGIVMQPGVDETQRNFSWYMPADVTECSIELSKNPLMLNAQSIEGKVEDTYQGDKVAKVTATGLELGETYYYVCVSGEDKSSMYSFKTVEDDSFSAMYISDIHITGQENTDSVKETSFAFADLLAEASARADINMILSAGDQASDGLRSEYEGLTFSPLSRSLSFATTLGNHDYKGVDYKYFTNLPNEDYGKVSSYQCGDYYFVKGEVLFLCLDSNNASATDHRNFVKKAVDSNPDLKWRVVVMHHDLYGGTIESRESENKLLRLLYSPIFDEFNIDLALLGHSHHYSITDVVYNGKSVEAIENGKTVENAQGTVYMVSASVDRPRESADIPYSDLIAIGMDEYSEKLYNIIDFSEDKITVTTYEKGVVEAHASFTLTKTDDYDAPEISFFRKAFGKFAAGIGTVYAFFNNFTKYFDLTDKGYDLDLFEVIF